ncbi:MAG: TIGR04255 family protein [candidate division Zixibacteria bacterium]|nr:TIGR04255 family protein [candidate division Zixibacteria bacterium]
MTDIVLKNKPLVEAIFELRWNLENREGTEVDPQYKLLVGRIFDRISGDYPDHVSLPAATMPDEFVAYVVQHQFRSHDTVWPLVQLGPGVITLNETQTYVWSDFRERIEKLLKALIESYPDADKGLRFNRILLRYIDAVDFDYEREDVFAFLLSHLKAGVDLHEGLFEGTGVPKSPIVINMGFSFPSTKPKGAASLRFFKGERDNEPALLWETHIQTSGDDVPAGWESILTWLDEAHKLTHEWFFKMIDGPLLEKFK